MFKKRCKNCNEKIEEFYSYCPSCGFDLKNSSSFEDWGLLGKDDGNPLFKEMRFSKGIDVLFKSLLKGLDTQVRDLGKDKAKNDGKTVQSPKKGIGISINISSLGNQPPRIFLNSFGDYDSIEKNSPPNPSLTFVEKNPKQKNLKNFSTLPKEEPLTNVRRLTDKVFYEVDLPGVRSLNDISISKLENSIEVRAISKNKAFFKLIPISLPLLDYRLSKGRLILELLAEG